MYRCCLMIFLIFLCGCSSLSQRDIRELEIQAEFDDGNIEEVGNERKKVGVAMPTKSSERWINDGINIKAQLEFLGYEVDLQYADDIVKVQLDQIESMVLNGVECLVIAPIDSYAMVDVLRFAKENNVYVIAYDRLIMDTDAISYYATFDNKEVGVQIGKYIIEALNLEEAKKEEKSYTIEFFMGSPDDNNSFFFYNGVMSELTPYLENGVLICKSGLTSFEDTNILRWSRATAKGRCAEILDKYYQNEFIDIICSVFDGFAYGIKSALLEEGYRVSETWPIITGQDAELTAVHNIVEQYQSMTIYKDTRILAQKCVTMVQADRKSVV